MARIGWLGLGAMGRPMARRLIEASHTVAAFDPVLASLEAFGQAGGEPASTAAAASAGAEALFVTVATPEQAASALFGAGGAAETLSEGSTVVVMSTIGPSSVQGLAERLAQQGVNLLDAPMSGGVARAGRGELVIMVGGPRDQFEATRPYLDLLGTTVAYVGEKIGDMGGARVGHVAGPVGWDARRGSAGSDVPGRGGKEH